MLEMKNDVTLNHLLTGNTLTGTHESLRLRLNSDVSSANLTDVLCLQPFLRLINFKLHISILIQYLETLIGNNCGKMDKNIFSAIRVNNETITLLTIEPLYFTFPLHDEIWGFILKGRCRCKQHLGGSLHYEYRLIIKM